MTKESTKIQKQSLGALIIAAAVLITWHGPLNVFFTVINVESIETLSSRYSGVGTYNDRSLA